MGAIHVCGTHHMGNFFSFDDGSDALILEEKKSMKKKNAIVKKIRIFICINVCVSLEISLCKEFLIILLSVFTDFRSKAGEKLNNER